MDMHQFLKPEKPWLHLFRGTEAEANDLAWAPGAAPGPKKIVARLVRGQKARTTPALLDQLAAVLQFPYYFGDNWDALEECLADLEWLPGDACLLVILNSVRLLEEEPAGQLQMLFKILEDAGRERGEEGDKGRAFHTLLQATPDEEPTLQQRLHEAKVVFDVLP